MDRRFLIVLGVSLMFALVVSAFFYQISSKAATPNRPPEPVALEDVITANKPLSVGVSVTPEDVNVVKVPISAFPKGGFKKKQDIVGRAVVSNILPDEPILEGRLAARGSGIGLAPIIPLGMRAVSVRVNEVVGVAGFVLPGMHVDVLVTGRPPGENVPTMTTTVLQDITVLTAGQTVQADPRAQSINAPVVTLLVTPDQAELLTLAGNETRIQLVLRNGSDKGVTTTSGRRIGELYGGLPGRRGPSLKGMSDEDAEKPRPRPKPPVQERIVLAPPPAAAPPPEQIVIIRGNQKSVETVAAAQGRNQ